MHSFLSVLVGAGLVQAYTIVTVDTFMNKNIDPIVYNGQYNKSHLHTFFGSDAVTASTNTSAELQSGCSSADNPNDFSAYWIPTLAVVNDTGAYPVRINRFSAYYKEIEAAEVAIPQNVKMVVGNTKATSQDYVDYYSGFSWFCEGADSGEKDGGAFPTVTCPTHLQALLLFHDCVNEDTLETAYSGTQNWNATFRSENRCPEGMKRMPKLRFSVRYDLRAMLPDGWSGTPPLELACGSSYCFHGDFINGWLPEAAENMLSAKNEFAGVDGPLGLAGSGSVCTETPTDAEPDKGTSDFLTSLELVEANVSASVRSRHERLKRQRSVL